MEPFRILFVCHGNICRSPMAEFVMKDIVRRHGDEALFAIASAATHDDEIGSPVHPGTIQMLLSQGVPIED
ncbi:MAG: low molecular weight phosphotyrosine protein phosphatase, partial [Raoultibacter sp.]